MADTNLGVSALKEIPHHPHWLTIKLLSLKEPSFSESGLRALVFNAADRKGSRSLILGNGLAPHIRRVGSKVLINHPGFLSWIEAQGQGGEA